MTYQVPINAAPISKPASTTRVSPKGSPSERVWIIAEAPLSKDTDKGYLFSSGMGWSYDKMVGEMGIQRYYCTYFDSSNPSQLYALLNQYCPPIVVCLDSAGKYLVQGIYRREDVDKWAGSLLVSDKLNYPHYVIPTHGPETCTRDWSERQVVKYIDYGKIKSELDYFNLHGNLQPLPDRQLVTDMDFYGILQKLDRWRDAKYLSVDIESVYPKEKSDYYGHPGYPMLVGISPNKSYGLSFALFREDKRETVRLWKAISSLFVEAQIIGQNFHSFDAWHFQMLGMPVNRLNIHDTMHMHAVLWPELSHKLQFLTRQYTRQPYYKDEGHHWTPKDTHRWQRYNALDTCVTYEVFEEMEKEAEERGLLI